MTTATLTSGGRVTIPAQIRASLGLREGDLIEFVEVEPGRFVIIPCTQPVQALKGLIRKPAKPVSIEAMSAAMAAHRLT